MIVRQWGIGNIGLDQERADRRNEIVEVDEMLGLAVGFFAFVVVWLIGKVYLKKQIGDFNSNLREIMEEAETLVKKKKRSKNEEKEIRQFEDMKRVIFQTYEQNKKLRVQKINWFLIALGVVIGYIALCVTNIFKHETYSFIMLIPVPVLVTGIYWFCNYLLDSEQCCVLHSNSASNLKVWLGVILPSISKMGKLKIMLGSMSPYPFSNEWFRELLEWLETKKKVTVQILSGKPDLESMNVSQRKRWIECWQSFGKDFRNRNIKLLESRPEVQFVVTNRLVRIERDHAPWTVRDKEQKDKLVRNHIRFFNFSLISSYNAEFDMLWKNAESSKMLFSSNKMRLQN